MSSETRFENRGPSLLIVAFLETRLAAGREYSTTRDISEGTGLSRKVVGVRMKNMMSQDWHGLAISIWSETVWQVKERIKHGQRDVRGAV